ncbi:c-type cytochrome [Psychrobacter sp. APC 3426]|uniref:c-type cytochrome n=1 Tax=Psychrobacter sp. APC 3426 TaxID=3035177 RepID=UPI0025B54D01|nr:c-type cytochrome [Psychrobacter sp. APC 3426]MDN3397933.1 c-type cytochrome [Psychrobacter sp. APC 3426]
MMNKQQRMNTLALSAISLSALLSLSACSGDNNTAEEPPAVNEPTETTAVVEEAPVAEPEVVTPEPVVEAEPTETMEDAVVQEGAAVLASDAGAKLYETNCKVCHDSGLLDAPKYGDKAAWAPRLTKGIETLHMHSAKGFNKMPAQATDKVSEAQVYAAVDYMIAAVS